MSSGASSTKKSGGGGGDGGGKDSCKALVVGIPTDLTDKGLEAMCRGSGKVKSASVVMDQTTGKSKGFGFVEFVNEDAVEAVVKRLNGTKLGSRTLNVRALQSSLGNQNDSQRKKTKRPCFSFVKKGRCTKGDNCRYSHFTNSSDGRKGGKGKDEDGSKHALRKTISSEPGRESLATSSSSSEARTEASNADDTPVTMTKVPEGFCFLYQRGSCHRGKACRFKHEKPDGEVVAVDTSRTQSKNEDEVFVSKTEKLSKSVLAQSPRGQVQQHNVEDDLGISSEESSGEEDEEESEDDDDVSNDDDDEDDDDDAEDDDEDEQVEEEEVEDDREEAEIKAAAALASDNEGGDEGEGTGRSNTKKRKSGGVSSSTSASAEVDEESTRRKASKITKSSRPARAAGKAITPQTDGAVWLGMDGKPLKLQEDDDGTYQF
jgi:hypothetical protein